MEATAKSELEFLYFTDPMCSWCYGFGTALEEFTAQTGDEIPLRVIPGGLRPDETTPMPDKMAKEIAGHWEHVREATGNPFDFGFFEKYPGFVYDTTPSCKAVALANELDATKALALQHEIQKRFYANAEDPTNPETLYDAAASVGFDRDEFKKNFEEPLAEELVRESFAMSRGFGVFSYPTLVMRVRDKYVLVTQGYRPLDQLHQIKETIIEKFSQPANESSDTGKAE